MYPNRFVNTLNKSDKKYIHLLYNILCQSKNTNIWLNFMRYQVDKYGFLQKIRCLFWN